MKKAIYFLVFIFVLSISNAYSDSGSITLNFSGQNAATLNPVELEKVVVRNLTQNCDTTVFGPDAQLILAMPDGIFNNEKPGISVSQNYPNPFSGSTHFDINLKGQQNIQIRLVNIHGAVVASFANDISQGIHTFEITIGKSGIYYAEISTGDLKENIKLIGQNNSSNTDFKISYNGNGNQDVPLKISERDRGFSYQPGDELMLIASSVSYPDETIYSSPATDMDYKFDMRPVPIAAFSVDKKSGISPLHVVFTDQSGNIPTSWKWDFGDGLLSTLQDNNHNYETSGIYNVTLIASNEYGSDTLIMKDYIEVKDVEIYCDTLSGYVPFIINFNGACKLPEITSWHWDFGDGETSNEQNPSHSFLTEDTYYQVNLVVTAGGEIYSANKTIHALNDLAEVNFTADITDGWVVQNVQFTSSTNVSDPIQYQWSFGDGGTSNEVNPAHTYDNIGTFTVQLQVWDNDGVSTEKKEDYISVRFCPGNVMDDEGNIYSAKGIGKYCWMTENLNMGTRINGNLGGQTDNDIAEKFCYDNDDSFCDSYGGLYQWDELVQYSSEENAQGLCPDGWHLSTDIEWDDLIKSQGGKEVAGKKLKTTLYWAHEGDGNNVSGFSAMPAGRFWGNEEFEYRMEAAYFWHTIHESPDKSNGYLIDYVDYVLPISVGSSIGFSARCVKNYTMKK